MAAGDFVFFSGQGRLFSGGTVAHVFRNERLAEQLWGRDDKGQTWECMFALDSVRPLDIPYAEMNRVVGYAPKNVVQGFTVLDEERSAALFDFLSLDGDLHPAVPTRDQLARKLASLGDQTERQVASTQRLEQGYLRAALLPRLTGQCALCGDVLPAQFLVTAHVKKRSACTLAQRLDVPNVAMLACKFGCDALFEEGFICVDEAGRVQLSPHVPIASDLGNRVARLRARSCGAFNPSRASYFAWHRQHTYRA